MHALSNIKSQKRSRDKDTRGLRELDLDDHQPERAIVPAISIFLFLFVTLAVQLQIPFTRNANLRGMCMRMLMIIPVLFHRNVPYTVLLFTCDINVSTTAASLHPC